MESCDGYLPCYCAENTEYLEENLRMVEKPFRKTKDKIDESKNKEVI